MKKIQVLGTIGILLVFSLEGCQTAPRRHGGNALSGDRISALVPYSGSSSSPTSPSSNGPPDEQTLIATAGVVPDQFGYVLFDPESQKMITSYNADIPFNPSSVSKLIPSIAARQILGPDYKFKTSLRYRGRIHDHVLKGDLYLTGNGDPFLTASALMTLAQSLKDRGVARVEGHFYYDETWLVHQESIDLTRDAYATFNPGVSALSSEFNQFTLRWRPVPNVPGQKNNRSVRAFTTPNFPSVDLGLADAGNGGVAGMGNPAEDTSDDTLVFYQKVGPRDRWTLSPYAPPTGKQSVPIKQSGLFTSQLLAKFALLNEVLLPEPLPGKVPAHASYLATWESPPLEVLIDKCLEFSNNLMAELINLAAARKLFGKATSLPDSAGAVTDWVRRQLPKTDWKGFHFENGSGLGIANRITPKQLAALLDYAQTHTPPLGRPFISLLPINGWKGTLTERLPFPDTAFHVWAKTGGQSYSSALAGYLFTQSGKKFIFAFLSTDFKSREGINQVTGPVPNSLAAGASHWSGQVRALQEQLLTSWIARH
jgi:D-alanyl-D-alanine carboxypeptidase/D-alanyl-D-alanine-endopeptidase (penicillin-binding protein 4)